MQREFKNSFQDTAQQDTQTQTRYAGEKGKQILTSETVETIILASYPLLRAGMLSNLKMYIGIHHSLLLTPGGEFQKGNYKHMVYVHSETWALSR